MRKFFLIPLLTLVCSVMAWGTEITEITVSNFADLKTQLSASGTADVVKLGDDIAYSGTAVLNIERSLTLDGQGHKISGYGKLNTKVNTSETTSYNTVIAVNYQGNVESELEVAIQNLSIGSTVDARHYGIIAFDGVKSLLLQNDSIVYTKNYTQPICVNGYQSAALELTIKDSYINAGPSGYPAYILKPIAATIKNSTFAGYCGLYFKMPQSTKHYGNNIGAAGSVVDADACTFDCPNENKGESNNFAIFPIEDHNITLNLHNCSYNAENLAENNGQRLVNLQYNNRTTSLGDVYVNISGDNTHIYNIENNDPNKLIWNGFVVGQGAPSAGEGLSTQTATDVHVTISGGTLNINPEDVRWFTAADNKPKAIADNGTYNDQSTGSGKITIDKTKYEVKEVKQGSVTLYRVVPRTTTLYNLNSDVPEEEGGAGQNPNTSFELSNGTTMTLDQPTTKAGYVEVSNATTVTVANSQTLVINNGLDVQGTSVVTAKPGSALVIGEGGIVTQSPANIVVEADNNGAASLLLDPTITVNQTPELTVKMVAKNVGKIGPDYYWHRFALPVDEVHVDAIHPENSTWIKDGHSFGTLLYKWDYTNNKWVSLSDVSEMQPFYGYTMTLEEEVASPGDLKEAGYIFKGKLMGNVPSVLNFSRQGYNYFGNSYTGYISIVKLVDELIGNDNLDGTVWMWDPTTQKYEGIPLNDLKNNSTASRYTGDNSWKAEVAPMQTFILRLMTEDTDTKANIDYATAVWGNPRYEDVTGALHAPARRAESNNETYVRVIVSAANGKADAVNFQEGVNFSDANDRGYDAAKYMNERTVNVYATVNGENYGTVATDNIEGKSLTISTIDEIAYTISFADVEGRELALRDNVSGQVINIEEGATYEFAAQPNSVVEGRFEIVSRADAPTAIENTEVKANAKGIYTIMGQYLGENFDILPAGVYVVDGVKIVK